MNSPRVPFMNNTVYTYTNAFNGKMYIGITNNVARRKKEHKNGKHPNSKFFKAIKKYGFNNFEYSEIMSNLSREEATLLECYLIACGDSFKNGYNATPGGDGGATSVGVKNASSKITEETVIKILEDNCSTADAAKKYNTSEGIVYNVRKGNTWTHVLGDRNTKYKNGLFVINEKIALLVINDNISNKKASEKYNISKYHVRSIRQALCWKNLDRSTAPKYPNENFKINEAEAKEIIRNPCSNSECAKIYGVSRQYINMIRTGIHYKHLDRNGAPRYRDGRRKQ